MAIQKKMQGADDDDEIQFLGTTSSTSRKRQLDDDNNENSAYTAPKAARRDTLIGADIFDKEKYKNAVYGQKGVLLDNDGKVYFFSYKIRGKPMTLSQFARSVTYIWDEPEDIMRDIHKFGRIYTREEFDREMPSLSMQRPTNSSSSSNRGGYKKRSNKKRITRRSRKTKRTRRTK